MNLLQHINGLFRFGAVGVVSTVVDFAIFAMLALGFDFNPVVANVIAYLVAVTNSFVLNNRFTFKGHGQRSVLAAYARFVAVNTGGLMVSTLTIYLLAGLMPALAAKLVAIAFSLFVNYFASYFFVYRPPS